MPKPGSSAEKDTQAFHLLPPDQTDGVRIYHLKLNAEVLDALAESGGAGCKVVLGGKDGAVISVRSIAGQSRNACLGRDTSAGGGGRRNLAALSARRAQVKGTAWKLEPPRRESGSEVTECLRFEHGAYRTLGPVRQRFSVRGGVTESEVEKIKRLEDEVSRQKAFGRAVVMHDPCQSARKRRREHGTRPDVAAAAARSPPQPLEASDADVTRRAVHELALGNRTTPVLLQQTGGSKEQLQRLVKDVVAAWDQKAQEWRLLDAALSQLDVDNHPDYTTEQRRVAQARVSLAAPTPVVHIVGEEEAARARARYAELYSEYVALDAELSRTQRHFEALAESATKAGGDKACSKMRERFERERMVILERHTAFMRLHRDLAAIRDALKRYKAGAGRA